jgi:23S rRNA (uracil1939-C5)-methyltransferase
MAAGRREDGKVVLVDHAVPGDVVEASPWNETSSLVRARILRVVSPSPHRCEPACPSFPACGGCSWLNYTRESQLRFKADVVNRLLSRLKLPSPCLSQVVHDSAAFGYRQRVRLHLSGIPGEPCRIGFFSHGTHDVVPIRSCPICLPELDRTIAAFAAWIPPLPLSASVEMVVTDEKTVLGVLYLAERDPDPQGLAETLVEQGVLAGAVVASPDSGWGRHGVQLGWLQVSDDARTPVQATSFCQANPSVNRLLIRHVVERVLEIGASRILELYAGHGNFTFPLAHAGAEVLAVEVGVDLAVLPSHPRVRFYKGDAVRLLPTLQRCPLVLLDPPRTGAKDLMKPLLKARPGHILYVSCDPNTFVRDAGILLAGGYRLADVTAFDMMPQTHHVEMVALLRRE